MVLLSSSARLIGLRNSSDPAHGARAPAEPEVLELERPDSYRELHIGLRTSRAQEFKDYASTSALKKTDTASRTAGSWLP